MALHVKYGTCLIDFHVSEGHPRLEFLVGSVSQENAFLESH